MADTPEGESEIRRVRRWRLERLEAAGYPEEEAWLLSGRLDIDVQVAVDLLRNGCPLSLAIRILT